jgi:hypothetical protein
MGADELFSFVKTNWVLFVGVAIIVAPSVVSFVKTKLGSFKLPIIFSKSEQSNDDLILKDVESLMWLTNRAIDSDNTKLVAELANVNSKLFSIHCDMRRSNSSSAR